MQSFPSKEYQRDMLIQLKLIALSLGITVGKRKQIDALSIMKNR